MRAAIVHDWLTGMRGGEKCLEVFCELLPEADIYSLLHIPGTVSETIERHRIKTSLVHRLPLAHSHYRHYLPMFPLAARALRISDVDLVLSSSHCVAKNVRVPDGVCHVAYIHTPMRYVWDQYRHYFGPGRAPWPVRMAMKFLRPWLQREDVMTARGVHFFIANSRHVAGRIQRYYGREATVIYPPVDVHRFRASPADEGYYLVVSAFAPYKRVDLAIEAFNRTGLRLKIFGSGQDEARLRQLAKPNVELLGWRSDREIELAYASCRALVFPGEEDFGIVPVEAMASGKPVIAYGRGGALETVVPLNRTVPPRTDEPGEQSPTGIFFYEQTADSLERAIRAFEDFRGRFDPHDIRRHVERFSRQRFMNQIKEYLEAKYSEFRAVGARRSPR